MRLDSPQKAEQGVATAQGATAAALGAAAGVAAGVVSSATNVTLGAAQAGAQVRRCWDGWRSFGSMGRAGMAALPPAAVPCRKARESRWQL